MSDLDTLLTAAEALCDPRANIERITTTDKHRNKRVRSVWVTEVPSLLDQLAAAMEPGETYAESEPVRGGFGPRPPARMDAVDRLHAIERAAAEWCAEVGIARRPTAYSRIKGLVGVARELDAGALHTLAHDAERWRRWAATVTGWERPPEVPRAPCPACDAMGALRVRLAVTTSTATACCMGCGAAWNEGTVGVLAAHIQTYLTRSEVDTTALRTVIVLDRQRVDDHGFAHAHDPAGHLPYWVPATTDT